MIDRSLSILIVEDEVPKSTQIEIFLRGLCIPMEIRTARSVNAALDYLDEEVPDLMLLDMSLPTIDVNISNKESGGRPQGFGGIEVLRHMKYSAQSCPTIVVTGYEAFPRAGGDLDITQLKTELEQEFPNVLHGVLHYNSTYETWKSELKMAFESFKSDKESE
ncbi:MAG: response regulator [Halopseudomonas sabulinigri]